LAAVTPVGGIPLELRLTERERAILRAGGLIAYAKLQ
jgi:hypothetical protein